MPSPQPALRQSRAPHVHIVDERCPVCDQRIPNEKAEEVRVRMEARERTLTENANARAAQQIAREKAQIEANANAAVERIRKEGAEAVQRVMGEIPAKEAAAREAGKKEADAALQQKLAAAEKAKEDAETGLRQKLATAEKAKEEVEAIGQERIAALQKASKEQQVEWQEKIATAERDKQGAVEQYESLKANQDEVLNERVQEVREAMEKANAGALGAEKAKHFEETQKLTGKLEALTRQLERKTAEELGEGAEINLFETLKAEFAGDRIERVGKGASGADIIHTVIHNYRECGRIIYDSKNSTRWYNDYVRKLVQDQTAAKAEHAILCTLKFPGDTRQLELRDGVIVVNPARVVALVQIIRKQIVLVHTLRLSRSERAKKMAALYDFITSEHCGHLLARMESHTDALLELQEKEMKAHRAHWSQEGTLLRSIQKVKAELETEIDQIIGAD